MHSTDPTIITEPLVTTEQMARVAQVHPTTLRDWARGRLIRHYRFGRVLRFRVEEVLADLAVPSR